MPVPPVALVVNVNATVRALVNPLGVKSEQLASYSTTYGDTRVGVYLTDEEIAMLNGLPGAYGHTAVYDVATPPPDVYTYGDAEWWEPGLWNVRGAERRVLSPARRMPRGRVARRR